MPIIRRLNFVFWHIAAGDEHLIQAYKEQSDIHRNYRHHRYFTYPFDEVTPLAEAKCKGCKFWYRVRNQFVRIKPGFKYYDVKKLQNILMIILQPIRELRRFWIMQ